MNTPPRAVREALAASEPTAPAEDAGHGLVSRALELAMAEHGLAFDDDVTEVADTLAWHLGLEPTAPRHHVYQDGLTLSGTGKTVPHAGVTTHTSEPRTFELKQTWTIRGSGLHLLTTFDGRTIWDGPPPLPYSPTDTEAETDNRVPEPTGVGEAEYERVESHIRCAFAAGYTLSAHHRPYDGEDDRGEPAAWDEYREHFNPTRLLLATHTQRADDE